MTAKISSNFECDLYIHDHLIVDRFLEWADQIGERVCETGPQPPYDLGSEQYRFFEVDSMWLFMVPNPGKYRIIHSPAEITNTLILHVYPNVPMQSLAEDLPKFLQALGVEEFELRMPRYERCVRAAVEFLLTGAKNDD